MSENEETASTKADHPSQSAPATPADGSDAASGPADGASPGAFRGLQWSPPPRSSRDGTSTPEPRTRAARRATAGVDAASGQSAATGDLVTGSSAPDLSPGVPPQGATERRRAWVLWAVIGAAVVVVAAVVVTFVLLSREDAEPPTATVTTTLAVPTPTSEPLDRTDATALVKALPGTVRQFVLTSVSPSEDLPGALEAYTVTYAGQALDAAGGPVPPDVSAGADAAAFTVTVAQWADAASATTAAQTLAADLGTPTATEGVTVGGDTTGSLSYFLPEGAAVGTALWTNGTVVLRAVGSAPEVVNFATAFGL